MFSQVGFTLVELLVVLVILGILVSLAIPKYEQIVTRSKKMEAKLILEHLYELQKTYRMEYDVFTSDFTQLGMEQEELITDGGKARYKVEIKEAEVNHFRATATSVVDFDGDGEFNIWEIDETGNLSEISSD